MAEQHDQLIARITEQVLAALKQNGAKVSREAPVAIRPPVGVCTGDYSKFTELQGRLGSPGGAVGGGGAKQTQGNGESTGPILRGFVTARQLEGLKGGAVTLSPDATLTPLAVDYVKEKKLTVKRAAVAAASVAGGAGGAKVGGTVGGWSWWIDGRCEAVEQLTAQRRSQLKPVGEKHQLSALTAAVRSVARDVKQNKAAGGVLFVHSAAQAACFANRCPSLRAVVGTCGEAVEQGIQLLAANVLIVEYPHVGPRAMQAMVDRFVTAERPNLPAVDRQLMELGRCD
ncbi:MAG: RpiB/LacA/LacB family sugar-phosphate isomerase [Phycisphaeraceae bacterium]